MEVESKPLIDNAQLIDFVRGQRDRMDKRDGLGTIWYKISG